IIVVLILLISATILTISLTTNQDTGAPNVFGYTLNTIQSPSMEPVMHKGDLIIGKIVDENTPEFKVGDIVIYTTTKQLDDGTNQYVLVCHRIVKTKVEGETTYYLTKGDYNDVTDEDTVGWLTSDKIVGVYENSEYKGTLLKGVGSIYDYLLDFWGFFFVIVLPMILFFIYELVRVIMNIVAYTKEKALVAATEAAQSAELTEAQKQKAIEEYLASQKANENSDKPDTNEKEE
ncbi:MAG: signal peptidase I, partial [Ruminococcus sp.]